MKVDVLFPFAKVYDIEKFDVAKGQDFSLLTDNTGTSKWFSDNDPVLTISVTGNNASVSAKEVGASTLLIMNDQFQVLKTISITVVESLDPATDLGAVASAPVKK